MSYGGCKNRAHEASRLDAQICSHYRLKSQSQYARLAACPLCMNLACNLLDPTWSLLFFVII